MNYFRLAKQAASLLLGLLCTASIAANTETTKNWHLMGWGQAMLDPEPQTFEFAVKLAEEIKPSSLLRTLERYRREAISERLFQTMDSSQSWQLEQRLRLIGFLADKRQAGKVIKLLEEKYVGISAAWALENLQAIEYADEIARLLDDHRPYVQEAAIRALGIIGAHEYSDAIAKFLDSPAVGQQVEKISKSTESGRNNSQNSTVDAAKDAADATTKAAMNAAAGIVKMFEGQPRQAAVWSLGRLRVHKYDRKMVEQFLRCDPESCAEAQSWLENQRPTIKELQLSTYLGTDDSEVRRRAARTVGLIRDKRYSKELVKLLADSDADVVADAVYAIGEIGATDLSEELAKLSTHSSAQVRREVVQVLGKFHAVRHVATIAASLEDQDRNVRYYAVLSLEQMRAVKYREAVKKRLQDRDSVVRIVAEQALATLEPQKRVAVNQLTSNRRSEAEAAFSALIRRRSLAHRPQLAMMMRDRNFGYNLDSASLQWLGAAPEIKALAVKMGKGESVDSRVSAMRVLATCCSQQYRSEFLGYLIDDIPEVRSYARRAILRGGPLDLASVLFLLDATYAQNEKLSGDYQFSKVNIPRGFGEMSQPPSYGEIRFLAHLLSGGRDINQTAIDCLGMNSPLSCDLNRIAKDPNQGPRYVTQFYKFWRLSTQLKFLRKDLIVKAKTLLKALHFKSPEAIRLEQELDAYTKMRQPHALRVNVGQHIARHRRVRFIASKDA
jgi:HEAT repeat protein